MADHDTHDHTGVPGVPGGAGSTIHALAQGRLTLTTAVPVTTSDVTAAGTLYFTPFRGNLIGTYSGSAWSVNAFTEKSASLTGLTADLPYDVYIVDSTLALELMAWTNATTRATALATQDGVLVKSGTTTRRYLGTVVMSATSQCEDSVAKRLVWNYYNRALRPMQVFDGTDTWSWNSASWRAANGTTTNHQLVVAIGVSEDVVRAEVRATATSSSSAGAVGVGVDVTNANSANLFNETRSGSSMVNLAVYRGFPGVGRHVLNWIEYARAGTHTFEGDDGVADQQSGIIGEVWA